MNRRVTMMLLIADELVCGYIIMLLLADEQVCDRDVFDSR